MKSFAALSHGFFRRFRKMLLAWFYQNIFENPHLQLFGKCFARISTQDKIIALTFDDGPYPPYTDELLCLLDQYGVKATFFLVGQQIERFPESARQIALAGHQIGNHSYSHPRMINMSCAAMREEIVKTDDLIRSIGYNKEIVFRAPFGCRFLRLPTVLRAISKKHILFDFLPNPRDWKGAPAEAVVNNIVARTVPGSIIVLHDGNVNAAPNVCAYTELLINHMNARGYAFVTVDQLLANQLM